MMMQDPVKIPDVPGIVFLRKEGKEYVRYVTSRQY